MPHVEIHIRKGCLKEEQKNEIARQIAATLRVHQKGLEKCPIHIIFMEYNPNDYEEV